MWKMAAKAYVVSMTVTELKEELKQRGLSTRGSKKSLRDRLEQVGFLNILFSYQTFSFQKSPSLSCILKMDTPYEPSQVAHVFAFMFIRHWYGACLQFVNTFGATKKS